jgi:hypothetical protein
MSRTVGDSPRTYAEFLAQPDIVRVVAELRESPIHSEKGIQLACMTTWANKLEITNQLLRERVAELEQKRTAADDFDECEWRLANKKSSSVKESIHVEQDHRLCEAAGSSVD